MKSLNFSSLFETLNVIFAHFISANDMSIDDVAQEFDVSKRTVYRWLKEPSFEQAVTLFLWMGYDFNLKASFQGPMQKDYPMSRDLAHPIYESVPIRHLVVNHGFSSVDDFPALKKNGKKE